MVREDDCNVLILHSSGTTGLPKPIPLAHRYMLGYAACHEFAEEEDESRRGITLSTLPLFHGFGFLAPCLSLSIGKPVCLPPPSTIATASLVVSLVERVRPTSMMTVPSILEDITLLSDFDSAASTLASLDYVVVGGGGIKSSVGHELDSKGVTLLNHFGATELGALAPIFRPEKGYNYNYLRLRTDMGLNLEFTKPDLRLNERLDARSCKLIGYPFGWGCPFELQDSLECNPLKPTSEVRILGRNDDMIVLGTGEKVLPHLLERALEQETSVRRAIVFGNGQDEIGVLIEPDPRTSQPDTELIEALWPTIVEANKSMDGHARISSKAAIIIKPNGKEIPLSDKGSAQRKEVYSRFAIEIERVYGRLQNEGSSGLAMTFDIAKPEHGLRNMVQHCLPDHVGDDTWRNEEDFIHLGLDSLQATRLRRTLCASLDHSQHPRYDSRSLPVDFVYSHPSVSKMAEALTQTPPGSGGNTKREMEHLTLKYAFDDIVCTNYTQGSVILLTGATGNLGAHLLQSLGENEKVKRVVCLLRSRTTSASANLHEMLRDRQRQALLIRDISLSDIAWSKIRLLFWNPGAKLLGLSQADYDDLTLNVTHIFHGAWPMDFQRKLLSFEPQVKAVRDLVELGRAVHRVRPRTRPKIVFASSIAVVGRHPLTAKSRPVPEVTMDDPAVTLPMGYAQAKWVCEKVLESAFATLQGEVDPLILRIGQLSGAQSTGFWGCNEHIPALLKASQQIGTLPDLQGVSQFY